MKGQTGGASLIIHQTGLLAEFLTGNFNVKKNVIFQEADKKMLLYLNLAEHIYEFITLWSKSLMKRSSKGCRRGSWLI